MNSARGKPVGDLKEDLRSLVSEVGGIPPDFDANAHFYTSLGIPSVKALHLLMGLEDRFDIQIPDAEFVEATSLERLHALISRLIAEKSR
jgi:acyl carrier protein